MQKLDELISKLKSFDDEIIKVIEEVVRENDNTILDMNAEDQLFQKGITRTGVEIASFAPYAPLTIEIKKLKGQPTSRVTLRDEGDFHRSFYIEYQSDGFQIKASDGKTDDLIERYGGGILGLTDENFAEFANDYVKPALNELLRKL
jgi:hypothetical protein